MIASSFSGSEKIWDVCVVGAGPVGLSAAMECASRGLEVAVLEAGGEMFDASTALDSHATIIDSRRHAEMELAVCRAFGGTSWTWGGRCVPFDRADFERIGGDCEWPIGAEDVSSYYAGACDYLRCGRSDFSAEPALSALLSSDIRTDTLERWSRTPRLGSYYLPAVRTSKRINVFLASVVVDCDFSSDGHIERVNVMSAGIGSALRARHVVLACGGVENTRLLLKLQRRRPSSFGGEGGALGRYYMGHISGKIATVQFKSPKVINRFDFYRDADGTYVRRRFTLKPEVLSQNGLLNIAFWPDNPPLYDPAHADPVLSSVFLLLATPGLGTKLLPEAIRRSHTGPEPRRLGPHLMNVLGGGHRIMPPLLRLFQDRFVRRPRKPGFLSYNHSGIYSLHFHAEQEPNSESRIVLSSEVDRFGNPRVEIDLRFTRRDAESAVGVHYMLDEALRRHDLGRLSYLVSKDALVDFASKQASDGFHQAGTTRMAKDKSDGVVDSNLKAFGTSNLYVAGSSVFRTSGQANSTLLAVALSIRLAQHISERVRCE